MYIIRGGNNDHSLVHQVDDKDERVVTDDDEERRRKSESNEINVKIVVAFRINQYFVYNLKSIEQEAQIEFGAHIHVHHTSIAMHMGGDINDLMLRKGI